ncbi:pyridoxal 5'-phosphate synthase [Antribacter sp. KLBMP9083]|uniref:Pyridoxal 5'-phosphate synthase n=1 Tax=Antribacter soli TaxID=2910976 RepID=A0AA41QDS1_9MICO|nr:pyridoxal 5'-phosphate synthase [Antribacter soli]MCF4121600.1 pyridoxal 5'-phosphate synthase [Antribacter soli]
MATTFRERVRALPTFGTGLPTLDPEDAAPTPHELFVRWFDEAVDAGLPAPHAMTLSTADAAGRVHARTVVLKDVTPDGWWFAGHANSRKGQDLTENPNAALTFLWLGMGRQVRVTGPVVTAEADQCAADFLARPDTSRAAGLVNRQGEPLASREDYAAEFARALDTVRAEPGTVSPTWTAYALAPTEVEFWQAGDDKGQTRLLYRTDGIHWEKGLLWP